MGTTHPFADFGFALSKSLCQVFLLQTLLLQDIMNPVNDTERQCYRRTSFRINLFAPLF